MLYFDSTIKYDPGLCIQCFVKSIFPQNVALIESGSRSQSTTPKYDECK